MMPIKFAVRSRYTGNVIYEKEATDKQQLLNFAAANRVDLYGANLASGYLRGLNLTGCLLAGSNLSMSDCLTTKFCNGVLNYTDFSYAYAAYADFRHASLCQANFTGANLDYADLRNTELSNAIFYGATLKGTQINWQSHSLIAEILRQEAGEDIAKTMVAGFILLKPCWCWKDFLNIDHDLREWALDSLVKHVIYDLNEGYAYVPEILLQRIATPSLAS